MDGTTRAARIAIAGAILAGMIGAAGCSRGGDEAVTATTAAPQSTTTTTPASTTTTAAPPAKVVGIEVSEKANAFIPEAVEIKAGEGVAFINQDPVLHQIMTDRGAAVEFDLLTEAGQTATTPALDPGRYDYFCALHDAMEGQITVL